MAEVFDFPYHTVDIENPESGISLQMGSSYVFTAPPSDPDQRTFNLHFPLMKFYLNEEGLIDATANPQLNMKALIDFYYEHKLWKSFQYAHPVHGTINVRFKKPLQEPEGLAGGFGVVKSFDVVLIEVV